MHTNSVTAAADLSAYFDTADFARANTVADLVLERLPNGELAWLQPPAEPCEDDDALFTITDAAGARYAWQNSSELMKAKPTMPVDREKACDELIRRLEIVGPGLEAAFWEALRSGAESRIVMLQNVEHGERKRRLLEFTRKLEGP